MHELAMARGLFKKLEDEARRKSLSKVSKVILSVGKASGIDPHFLEHSLKHHIFPGTIFEQAHLEVKLTEPTLACQSCSNLIKPGDLSEMSINMVCPFCGSFEVGVLSGDEVEIVEIK